MFDMVVVEWCRGWVWGYVLMFCQTILDCSEANEGFYVKCGFKRAGLEMAHYYGR
jgi:hypothetical protein